MPPAKSEHVELTSARGRILAQRIVSAVDLPVFDNSAMDGYAVRADDVRNARNDAPATLKLIGRVAAGEVFSGHVNAGECVRIFTGSPLPNGADAVVMQEDTRIEPSVPEAIQLLDGAKRGENVRLRG